MVLVLLHFTINLIAMSILTIVKSQFNYVFCGYTTRDWSPTIFQQQDSGAFLLSLRRNLPGFNVTHDATRMNVKPSGTINFADSAILINAQKGPSFGLYDFSIFNSANNLSAAWSSLGVTYELPSGLSTLDAASYLGGCALSTPLQVDLLQMNTTMCFFNITEIEVFKLVN